MALPLNAAEITAKQVPQGSIDPNVKIPKSVVDAGKRSEVIQRALNGEAEPSVAAAAAGNGNGAAIPDPVAPPQVPAPAGDPAVPAAGVQPLPAAGQDNRPVDWERQFKSLNGRLEAEMKRNREVITQLSEQLDRTQRENADLRAGVTAQPQTPQQPVSLITEQELSDYGPEFIDVVRRVAAETAAPLNSEINSLRSQLGHVQQETGNVFLTRMNATISGLVPKWQELNRHPRFMEWSQLPDVFSGAIRKTLMQDAWNSGDANRVAAFFRAFLAEEAATNPQGGNGLLTPTPYTAPAPSTEAGPAFTLEALAAPGRAHSAGGAPAEKPVYTSADITKFYTDVAAGRWRGRDQQRMAIDADIIRAQHEGRIIVDQRSVLPR